MPDLVLRYTEEEKHKAAEAIFKMRHPSPGFRYVRGSDTWAYQYACAALDALSAGG